MLGRWRIILDTTDTKEAEKIRLPEVLGLGQRQ